MSQNNSMNQDISESTNSLIIKKPNWEKARKYWKSKLHGELPAIQIPSEFHRPPVQAFIIEQQELDLNEKLVLGLKKLSESENVSLFTIILSLYNVTLMRYTGYEDIICGTVTTEKRAHRSEAGEFINLVPLRSDLSKNPNFTELFSRISETVHEASKYKDFPFTDILKNIKSETDTNIAPIFQNMIIVCNDSNLLYEEPISEDDIIEIEEFSVRCDSVLIIYFENTHIKIKYNYDSELFSSQSAKQFLRHFKAVIENAIKNPESGINEFGLLAEKELNIVIGEWNANKKDYATKKSIHELFQEQAKRTPDSIAVSFQGHQITYNELNNRSNLLAHFLRSSGVGAEVKVGLGLNNSIEQIVGILGILKSGGVYVPLDSSLPENRLTYIISQSDIKFVITNEELTKNFNAYNKVTLINLDTEAQVIANFSTKNPPSNIEPDNLAYIIYTSGSTGRPKGVSIPHKGITNRLLWGQDFTELCSDDRFLQSASIGFDASLWQIFGPLISGGCLVLSRSDSFQNPKYLAEIISKEKVTFADFVPTMLNLVTQEAQEPNDVLRCVTCGGEPLNPNVKDTFFSNFSSSELHNCYGPTETSIDATCWVCDSKSPDVSIGRPIANTSIYILDKELNPVPINVVGDLYIGGQGLAREYVNRPDLTAEGFVPNSFTTNAGSRIYKTGDLARYRFDGNIDFLGRQDNQINIGGYRIELEEIKNVIREHPDVADAVVVTSAPNQNKEIEGASNFSRDELSDRDKISEVTKHLESLNQNTAHELLGEFENMSESDAETLFENLSRSKEEGGHILKRKTSDFELSLEIKSPEFINPPQENQRNWTLQRTVDEFIDDLINLDKVTKRFVKGSERLQITDDWDKSKAEFDDSQLVIEGQQVMQDWERPLMKAMAEIVSETHGDVLEVGFGMGISSTYIQKMGVKSHTIIECNDEVIENFNKWKEQYPQSVIKLIYGQWQNVADQLESYDGVFFDTYPLSEEEFIEYAIKDITFAEHFFSTAAEHLKEGGIFTYYTNEIDSFSRRHQRLLLKYFKSYTLSKVEPLNPPEDCNYWWADSMMTVKAIK